MDGSLKCQSTPCMAGQHTVVFERERSSVARPSVSLEDGVEVKARLMGCPSLVSTSM